MNEEEKIKKNLGNYFETKGHLTLLRNEENFCSMERQTLKRILEMINERDLILNWVRCIIITHKEIVEKVKTFSVQECYQRLLREILYYYVIKPKYVDLPEEEKIEGTTRIGSRSFKKINQMAGNEWIEFLNCITIFITEITYSRIQKIIKKERNTNIVQLLRFILTYCMEMKNGQTIDITSYSIFKILRMMDMNKYDLLGYCAIIILRISYEEVTLRKCRLRTLERQSRYLTLKHDISLNETSSLVKMKVSEDNAPKMKKHMMYFLAKDQQQANDVLNRIQKNNQRIVSEANCEIEKDDCYIEVNDTKNNKAIIRKALYKEIISTKDNKDDDFKIQDYRNQDVVVSKKTLMNMRTPNCAEYINLFYNDDQSTNRIKPNSIANSPRKSVPSKLNNKNILVPRNIVIALFKNLKNLSKTEEIQYIPFSEDTNTKILKAKPRQLSIVPLQKVELTSKPNPVETQLVEKKKETIIMDLNKDDNTLIEYEPKIIFRKLLCNRIVNHLSNFDAYKVRNYYDDTDVVVSKKRLKAKPPNVFIEYIYLITPQKKKIILNKKDYLDAISEIKDPSKTIALPDYKTGEITTIAPIETTIVLPEPKELELPYQENEAKEVKDKIEKDLSDDNEFYLIPEENFLVRKTAILKLCSKENDKNPSDTYEVVDSEGKPRKISRRRALAENLEPIVEVTDDESKKKLYVTKKDLKTGLDDMENDNILFYDIRGAKCNIKKNKLAIINQPPVELPKQEEPTKLRLVPETKHYFVNVQDEKGNNQLIRKDYIPLINSHKSQTLFDRYEVPNSDSKNIFLSKKDLTKVNPEELNDFVYVKKKNIKSPSNKYYIPKNNLIQAYKDNPNGNNPAKLSLPDYDFQDKNGSKNSTKSTYLNLDEIEVVELDKVDLPYQEEEKWMKMLNDRKAYVSKPNDDIEFIEVINTSNKPILIRKQIIKQIDDVNKGVESPRMVFNIVNSVNDSDDKINIKSIPPNLNDREKNKKIIYTPIIKPTHNNGKPVYVNFNQLSDCLDKTDNPRKILEVNDYPNNLPIRDTSVIGFDFVDLDKAKLPPQDEMKPSKPIEIDRIRPGIGVDEPNNKKKISPPQPIKYEQRVEPDETKIEPAKQLRSKKKIEEPIKEQIDHPKEKKAETPTIIPETTIEPIVKVDVPLIRKEKINEQPEPKPFIPVIGGEKTPPEEKKTEPLNIKSEKVELKKYKPIIPVINKSLEQKSDQVNITIKESDKPKEDKPITPVKEERKVNLPEEKKAIPLDTKVEKVDEPKTNKPVISGTESKITKPPEEKQSDPPNIRYEKIDELEESKPIIPVIGLGKTDSTEEKKTEPLNIKFRELNEPEYEKPIIPVKASRTMNPFDKRNRDMLSEEVDEPKEFKPTPTVKEEPVKINVPEDKKREPLNICFGKVDEPKVNKPIATVKEPGKNTVPIALKSESVNLQFGKREDAPKNIKPIIPEIGLAEPLDNKSKKVSEPENQKPFIPVIGVGKTNLPEGKKSNPFNILFGKREDETVENKDTPINIHFEEREDEPKEIKPLVPVIEVGKTNPPEEKKSNPFNILFGKRKDEPEEIKPIVPVIEPGKTNPSEKEKPEPFNIFFQKKDEPKESKPLIPVIGLGKTELPKEEKKNELFNLKFGKNEEPKEIKPTIPIIKAGKTIEPELEQKINDFFNIHFGKAIKPEEDKPILPVIKPEKTKEQFKPFDSIRFGNLNEPEIDSSPILRVKAAKPPKIVKYDPLKKIRLGRLYDPKYLNTDPNTPNVRFSSDDEDDAGRKSNLNKTIRYGKTNLLKDGIDIKPNPYRTIRIELTHDPDDNWPVNDKLSRSLILGRDEPDDDNKDNDSGERMLKSHKPKQRNTPKNHGVKSEVLPRIGPSIGRNIFFIRIKKDVYSIRQGVNKNPIHVKSTLVH